MPGDLVTLGPFPPLSANMLRAMLRAEGVACYGDELQPFSAATGIRLRVAAAAAGRARAIIAAAAAAPPVLLPESALEFFPDAEREL